MVAGLVALGLAAADGPATWGAEALKTVRRDYYLEASRLYAEHAGDSGPAFNWGAGVMLSALNAAARHDRVYEPWLREYADATRSYWNRGGYDVLPGPKPFDRYYDDNAWMALALVETYEVLGDAKYLHWARQALSFSLSGESLKGGVFWRESDRASRNTCSCGPTAAACLAVYAHTGDQALLESARRIVAWARANLEDPADGLYWDSVDNSGNVERTKWTYNTALMLRARNGLGEGGLGRALEGSRERWLREGRIHDPGRFAHLLLEAWASIEGPDASLAAALKRVWDARSTSGHLPPHWGKAEVPARPELLDQAAFVRACFVLAASMPGGR